MPLLKVVNSQDQYNRNADLKKDDVMYLQKWLEKQPHLPPISELELIIFLHSCYYSIERTKQTIDAYFTLKTACPELFGKQDFKKFQASLNESVYAPLPMRTSEGYQVVLIKLLDCNPYTYSFENHIKYSTSFQNLWLLENGIVEGMVFLLDLDGFALAHLTRVPLSLLKYALAYLQEALPVRLKAIHLFNTPSFIEQALAIIKPFMNTELINLLHLHTRNSQSLYKYVSLENFPRNYGGSANSLEEFHEKTKKFILDNFEFIEENDKRLVEESKRQDKSRSASTLFGTEGSFRKLEID